MKLYGEIDLHSNNNVLSLLDENDRLIYEQRLPNELDIILVELAPLPRGAGWAGGDINIQLVLVSGWVDGGGLYGAFVQSCGN